MTPSTSDRIPSLLQEVLTNIISLSTFNYFYPVPVDDASVHPLSCAAGRIFVISENLYKIFGDFTSPIVFIQCLKIMSWSMNHLEHQVKLLVIFGNFCEMFNNFVIIMIYIQCLMMNRSLSIIWRTCNVT